MRYRLVFALVALVAMTLANSTSATIIDLSASMDGPQANAGAGTGSPGLGLGIITLDDVTNQLSWSINWGGLVGSPTAMHFHGPALSNQNAGVQVGVGVVGTPVIGNAILNAVQEADLLAGLWYLNLHTNAFPGGEIRGQVLNAVPEPSSLVLATLGLLGIGYRRRKRA
jgi:hypothetical protein